MMGDSGREHVRCSKADWCEKRERRTIPSPQTQNGNRERHGQSREVVSLPVSPTTPCSTRCPSRQAHISPCPHPACLPWGPQSPGLGGQRQLTSNIPIDWRPLGWQSCSPHSNKPSMPRRAPGMSGAPDPNRIRGPSRARALPSGWTDSVPPPRSYKDTSHLPGSQRAWRRVARGGAGAGTHRRRAAERPAAPPPPPVLPPAAALAAVAAVLPMVLVGMSVVCFIVCLSPIPAIVVAPVAATVSPVVHPPVRGTVIVAASGTDMVAVFPLAPPRPVTATGPGATPSTLMLSAPIVFVVTAPAASL